MKRSAYAQAALDALLQGFYVPDVIDVYLRYDGFRTPHMFAVEFH